jgi:uncharacterized secreted protein with C-terminal beta-propeller domain
MTDKDTREQINPGDKPKKHNNHFLTYGVVAVIALLLVASGVFLVGKVLPRGTGSTAGSIAPFEVQTGTVQAPGEYGEIFAYVKQFASTEPGVFELASGAAIGGGLGGVDTAIDTVAPLMAAAPMAMEDSAFSTAAGGASGYTETNVQVEGIDEGDIVKTDGEYIYVLSNSELIIFSAKGAATKEVSRTSVVTPADENSWGSASELYLAGDTVVVIRTEYLSGDAVDYGTQSSKKLVVPGSYNYGQEWTTAAFYDVSDPANPAFIQSQGQSGNYSTSRLEGDVLYLISRYWIYSGVDEDEPGTFVPLLRSGDDTTVMSVGDIRIMPTVESASYAVVTSLDVTNAERIDQKSVLGNAETVYMSHGNLYLGSTIYASETKEPYQDSVYMVEEHIERQTTQLIRIGIDAGALDVAAQCTIEGSLLNQFSLDEYEGNLRVVMTLNDYSYKILKDESHGVEAWQSLEDNPTTNAVYVLNASLETIGSVTGLAETEQIYSARFDGPIGYMVTYRQIDPLFAIDLSNPTAPKVTSELKIPGFSTYLHPFGAGRLLGLGYNADGAIRGDMKLSMFDVSDPFDVRESDATGVELSYSEALSNHKAVLVDIERNIIGFPGDGYSVPVYYVYSYDEDEGFVLVKALELSSVGEYGYYGLYGTRGLIIGENLYVCSGSYLDVFNFENFSKVFSCEIQASGGPGYATPMPLIID